MCGLRSGGAVLVHVLRVQSSAWACTAVRGLRTVFARVAGIVRIAVQ